MTDATMTVTSVANRSATRETGTTDAAPILTIGIDLGDKHSHLCVLDGDGAKPDAAPTHSFAAALGGTPPSGSPCRGGTPFLLPFPQDPPSGRSWPVLGGSATAALQSWWLPSVG